MSDEHKFMAQNELDIEKMRQDKEFASLSKNWFLKSLEHNYSYHFRWLGLPIIQYPQDMLAVQEIIFQTQPDIIIETGVARGGSLVFSASLLQLLGGDRKVIGIDIEIRPHNRQAIETHFLANKITLIEGSSVAEEVISEVKSLVGNKKVMVCLDSMHTAEHVLRELQLYSDLVTPGCYLIVFDTVIADIPKEHFANRPWGPSDNPKMAVKAFLQTTNRFVIDPLEDKLGFSVAPSGYLKCIK